MPNQEVPSVFDKKWGQYPRRLCVSHSHFNAANFCRDGTGHVRFSDKQTWKSIWNKHNIAAWSGRYLSLLWQLNYFWKVSIVLYFQVKLLFTFRDISCCCSSHHCHSMNLWRKLTGKWLNTNPDDI